MSIINEAIFDEVQIAARESTTNCNRNNVSMMGKVTSLKHEHCIKPTKNELNQTLETKNELLRTQPKQFKQSFNTLSDQVVTKANISFFFSFLNRQAIKVSVHTAIPQQHKAQ